MRTARVVPVRTWDAGGEGKPAPRCLTWLDAATAVVAGDNGWLAYWDVETGAARTVVSAPATIRDVCVLPDGGRILTAGADAIRLREARSGAEIATFGAGSVGMGFRTAFVDGTGAHVVGVGWPNQVRIFDVASGACVRSFEVWGYPSGVPIVAACPDGSGLITVDAGYALTRWNLAGEPVGQIEGFDQRIESLAFTSGGRTLLTAHRDARLRAWDLRSGALVGEHPLPVEISGDELEEEGVALPALAASDDGATALVALSRGEVLALELQTGRARAVLDGPPGGITRLAFAAGGRRAIGFGPAGRLTLWELG